MTPVFSTWKWSAEAFKIHCRATSGILFPSIHGRLGAVVYRVALVAGDGPFGMNAYVLLLAPAHGEDE